MVHAGSLASDPAPRQYHPARPGHPHNHGTATGPGLLVGLHLGRACAQAPPAGGDFMLLRHRYWITSAVALVALEPLAIAVPANNIVTAEGEPANAASWYDTASPMFYGTSTSPGEESYYQACIVSG